MYLWAMTVFVLQLAPAPVFLILSDAGFSSSFSRILIKQSPALVDLKRHSYNNQTNVWVLCIIFNSPRLYKLVHWHASKSQSFVKDMQCFAVVSFTAFESNHTADTGLSSF